MFKNYLPITLGLTIAGLALTCSSASAAKLTYIGNESTLGTDNPPGWTDLNWTTEGKIGGNTWEIALEDGAYNVKTNQDWTWYDNKPVDWTLLWDANTKKVIFTLSGLNASNQLITKSISYTANTNVTDFTGFYLWTRSTDDNVSNPTLNKTDPGTSISLAVTQINGIAASALSSATSPTKGMQITKNFFLSDTPITSMKGTVAIDWTGLNPQSKNASSLIGFKIKGFQTPKSVPESSTLLGLLGIGVFGLTTALKRKNQS